MDLGLQGKTGIVTGSGRGIGRRIALTLAEEGVNVVVNDIDQDRADAVAGEIKAAGGNAIGIKADVTDRPAVDAMVEQTIAEFGRLEILINNAGIPLRPTDVGGADLPSATGKYFIDTDPEGWDRTMRVITYGVLHCTQAVVPHMMENNYGKIVSLISDAGIVGEPRLVVYSMAKAGVIGFSRALAKELGRFRINVNCVSPGATSDTGRRGPAGARDTADSGESDAAMAAMLRLYPMGKGYDRLGVPSDVADPVVYLCSDRATWITGVTIRASGGYSIA